MNSIQIQVIGTQEKNIKLGIFKVTEERSTKICLKYNWLGKQYPSASAYEALRLIREKPGQFETSW